MQAMISAEYCLIDHYLGGVPHEEHELGGYAISAKGKLRQKITALHLIYNIFQIIRSMGALTICSEIVQAPVLAHGLPWWKMPGKIPTNNEV